MSNVHHIQMGARMCRSVLLLVMDFLTSHKWMYIRLDAIHVPEWKKKKRWRRRRKKKKRSSKVARIFLCQCSIQLNRGATGAVRKSWREHVFWMNVGGAVQNKRDKSVQHNAIVAKSRAARFLFDSLQTFLFWCRELAVVGGFVSHFSSIFFCAHAHNMDAPILMENRLYRFIGGLRLFCSGRGERGEGGRGRERRTVTIPYDTRFLLQIFNAYWGVFFVDDKRYLPFLWESFFAAQKMVWLKKRKCNTYGSKYLIIFFFAVMRTADSIRI